MSVINQMLKDLDQRSSEANTLATHPTNMTQNYSPIKVAIVTAISVLAVCLVSFYVWQLSSENNALRADKILNSPSVFKEVQAKKIAQVKLKESHEKLVAAVKSTQTIAANNASYRQTKAELTLDSQAPTKQPSQTEKIPSKQVTDRYVAVTSSAKVIAPRVANNNTSIVTPAKQVNRTALLENNKANNMSVSRRQLSASELAQQKLAQVEKALAAKQITKAEKLLEDVVIITPEDSQSRKKLAALWFGRQAYQDALNLLSQGIALDGKDSSLRLMKARIYLKQGQAGTALKTLRPLAQLKDEQYQIMLANTAQKAQHHKAGIDAYKMLITMQPDRGRWHLGLAVLYDKDSQFTLASDAYKKALTKNDLSVSSEQFVKKRIQAIGQ